jgi:hypothetical protein
MKLILNRQHPQRTSRLKVGDMVENTSTGQIYKLVGWTYCMWTCWREEVMRYGCKRARNVMILKNCVGYNGTGCFCVGSPRICWKVVHRGEK